MTRQFHLLIPRIMRFCSHPSRPCFSCQSDDGRAELPEAMLCRVRGQLRSFEDVLQGKGIIRITCTCFIGGEWAWASARPMSMTCVTWVMATGIKNGRLSRNASNPSYYVVWSRATFSVLSPRARPGSRDDRRFSVTVTVWQAMSPPNLRPSRLLLTLPPPPSSPAPSPHSSLY